MSSIKRSFTPGAVSLFIVVFSALLMTVVTVSFVTLMITNQQHATENDLSQSALDSAQAGVEDAKRALLEFESQCGGSTSGSCAPIVTAMSTCNGIFGAISVAGASNGSVVNVGDASDASYQQEYTCVKVILNTDDYLGTLSAGQSVIVPLTATGSFDTVQLSWYNPTDLQNVSGDTVSLGSVSPTPQLLSQANWPANRPSILRTELMQFDSSDGFTLNQFDSNSSGQSDAATMFLYPTSGAINGGLPPSDPSPVSLYTARETSEGTTGTTPFDIPCQSSLTNGGYACSVNFTLPQAIGGGTAISFLRLTALYNATHFEVKLLSSGNVVDFQGVQPEIDSTGRSNDVYRRVATRVVPADQAFPYPDDAVETTGNFCKDFFVSNNVPDTSVCTP
jgi:hypothetical protein